MEKIDIAKTNLYFRKIISVVKSEINNNTKPIYAYNRHSDAFVYILSGSCSYDFDDDYEFSVNQGDILYLACGADYIMQVQSSDYRFIYCDFEFDGEGVKKSNVYYPQNISDAENLFIRLLKSYKAVSKTSFAECMSIIYKIYEIILMTENKSYIGQSAENKIIQAKEYINANFTDSALNITMLAEQAGISEVYFRKLFKQQCNIPPSQYIISMRIRKAKQLLGYSFLTLEKCAHQSGFSSVQYFCRVFKKMTGMTPSEYRNRKIS